MAKTCRFEQRHLDMTNLSYSPLCLIQCGWKSEKLAKDTEAVNMRRIFKRTGITLTYADKGNASTIPEPESVGMEINLT